MKRVLPMLVSVFFVTSGISILIFVVRMIWFPPCTMCMMMGRNRMFHHMTLWVSQTFWLLMIVTGFMILIWLLINRIRVKK